MIKPSSIRSVGMFGSPDGNPNNDLVTRDGAQIEAHRAFDHDFFHETYVDSWRISQDESLFHYEAGESTATFDIAGFPETWLSVADIVPTQRSEAEEICREIGVTREYLLDSCIFDVGLTDDPSFAYHAALVQLSTPEPSAPTGVVDPGDNENSLMVGDLRLDFGPDAATTDSWVCEVSDGNFRAQASVGETPDRQLDVTIEYGDSANSVDGTDRFMMVVNLGGAPYAWMLTWVDPNPGSIENLTLADSTLSVTGTAYLNEPQDRALSFASPLPACTEFDAFALEATCPQ